MKKNGLFNKQKNQNAESGEMTGLELLRQNNRKKSIQSKKDASLKLGDAQKEKERIIFPTDKTPLGKVSFFVKLAAIIIVIFILIMTIVQFMEYSKLEEEKKQKEQRLEELQGEIDKLNYYISSPIDEYYVRKFAWEIFGMVPSDGDVVIVNP